MLSTVPSVRNICMTDGTVPRPSVPSSPAENSMSANDGRRRQKYRHRPSSTVTGRHRAVTINTYTLTLERAVQDINRFIYISRLSISSKNSGSDRADVDSNFSTSYSSVPNWLAGFQCRPCWPPFAQTLIKKAQPAHMFKVEVEKLDYVLSKRPTRPYIYGHSSAIAYVLTYV